MKNIYVSFDSIDSVKEFVGIISPYNTDFEIITGGEPIDAKSILGIFSIDLSRPVSLSIKECSDMEEILQALKPFTVD